MGGRRRAGLGQSFLFGARPIGWRVEVDQMRMIALKRMTDRIRVTSDQGEFDVVFSAEPTGQPGANPSIEMLPNGNVDKQAAEELMLELLRDGRLRRP
jgi:hypothetical protein